LKLEARDITVTAGARTLVDGVSFDLSRGELVGLVGPNGAGKSTLVRAALGLHPMQAGEVRLNGKDLFALPARERAREIAFLPQTRAVEWRLPVRDVVMLGRFPHRRAFAPPSAADHAAVDRALAAVGAESIADQAAPTLSGGERSRVLLARALAVEAPLLVVDEPNAALDPFYQLQTMEILQGLARLGVGVLAVIHELQLAARFMDRLILLNRGRVACVGAPADVLTPARLAEVYQIDALVGEHKGQRWIAPWSRTAQVSKPRPSGTA
jgi:iron complex transport system ATP-binding protein